MQVKGALKKANLKVAMGSPSTARYSAYIALLSWKAGKLGTHIQNNICQE